MADQETRREVAPLIEELAAQLRAGADEDDIYQAIAECSVRLVPGCDHASVSILRGDQFRTLGASDEVARKVDDLEREANDGPCLDAVRDERVQHDADITRDPTWPELAKRTLDETPVRSMLAFRLIHEDVKGGALNLFGDTAGALDDESIEQGAILAAFASIAFSMAQDRRRAANLEQALDSNREIGKAIGLLMAAHNVSSEQALEMLKHASQNMNRKLRDLAAEIVARGEPSG